MIRVTVGDRSLQVAVADSTKERRDGLRGVEGLGDLDGMLFSWEGEQVTAVFTMRGTPLPLDILFFDRDGRLVDALTMTPCFDDSCPVYSASAPYAYALEVPAGSLGELAASDGMTLTLGGG